VIDENDGVERGLQDGVFAGFAIAQRLLSLPAFGDVMGDQLQRRPFLELDVGPGQLHIDLLAIGADQRLGKGAHRLGLLPCLAEVFEHSFPSSGGQEFREIAAHQSRRGLAAQQANRGCVDKDDFPGRICDAQGIGTSLHQLAESFFALPQFLLLFRQLLTMLGIQQRAADDRHQAGQVSLEDTVRRASGQGFDGQVFAERIGDEDEGNIRAPCLGQCQSGKAVELRQSMIGQD
jgi:hypothetical protein